MAAPKIASYANYLVFGAISVYSIVASLYHMVIEGILSRYWLTFGPYGVRITAVSGIIVGAYLLVLLRRWKLRAFPLFVIAIMLFDVTDSLGSVLNFYNNPMLWVQFLTMGLTYFFVKPNFKFDPDWTVVFVVFWMITREQEYPAWWIYEIGLFIYFYFSVVSVRTIAEPGYFQRTKAK